MQQNKHHIFKILQLCSKTFSNFLRWMHFKHLQGRDMIDMRYAIVLKKVMFSCVINSKGALGSWELRFVRPLRLAFSVPLNICKGIYFMNTICKGVFFNDQRSNFSWQATRKLEVEHWNSSFVTWRIKHTPIMSLIWNLCWCNVTIATGLKSNTSGFKYLSMLKDLVRPV